METMLQDIRFGLRTLWKSPGFTVVAALTLALGIGANTAIFSLVNGILLRPLPYSHPEQLVGINGTYPRGAFAALRQQVHTMDVATYAEGHEFNLTGTGEPTRLTATMVSAELFSVLGARPKLGRVFSPGEDIAGQDSYIILSHALWEQRFGSDPSIVGRVIAIDGMSRQVLGVMPAEFRFPSAKTQVWVPLHIDLTSVTNAWGSDYMPVIGRLRAESSLEQAGAEIRLFQSRVGELFPFRMPTDWNADISVVPLQGSVVGEVRGRLLMLTGAAVLILLIACANVANLMLSRAATREKEIGIRSALGAGRGRIARQLLTESVVLGCLGGVLGLAFAAAGLSLLKFALPANTPRLADVQLDWRVLAFTFALSALTGLIFGLAPASQASRTVLTEPLKSGGRGTTLSVSQRLRSSLAVVEVGFAALLVIAAGLLIRSFWALSHVDPGFQAEHLVTARITPNQSFCSDTERCLNFYRNLLDQVQGSPGVSGAALVNTLPLGGRVAKRSMNIEGFVASGGGMVSPLFWMNTISPEYFRVMNVPLVSGRSFSAAEMSGNPPVAIVNAETARRFWPEQEVIGKHIRMVGEMNWRTVIGVAADVRAFDLKKTIPDYMRGTVYLPLSPSATLEDGRVPSEMTMALRTSSDESQAAAMLQRIVATLNHEVPVSEVRTMNAVLAEAVSTPASTTSLLATFAGLALALGMVGVYGVLAFLVAKRTREIGVRIALGAQRVDVLWLVLKEGAKFAALGICLGLGGAFVATRWLSSELYGVTATDPFTYGGVALVMGVVSMLACYIPARRAMAVDPMVALRYE